MSKLDGSELVEKWQDQNKAYHFEGTSGLNNLEKLLKTIGYKDTGLRQGSAIECFLSDNSAAIEKIVEFIAEEADNSNEWREDLEAAVGANEPRELTDDERDELKGAGEDYANDNPDSSIEDLQGGARDLALSVLDIPSIVDDEDQTMVDVAADIVYEGMLNARKSHQEDVDA